MDEQENQVISVRPGPVKQFYRDLVMLLTEPRGFFKVRYPEVNLTYALAFGIIVNWIAAFFDWLTRMVKHETLLDGLNRMRHQLEMLPFWKNLPDTIWEQNPARDAMFPVWLAEFFGIILSPFQSLVRFCISGFILFLGAYFLIRKKSDLQDRIDISAFIKLTAFSSAPYLVASILGFLPLGFGAFIGWVFSIAVLVMGLTTRYRISGLRSVVIIILPGVMAIMAVSCLIGVIAALGFGLFAALFGSH